MNFEKMPDYISIGAILRNSKIIIPNQHTEVLPGDELLLFTKEKDISKAPFRLIGLGLENFERNNDFQTLNDLFSDHSKKLEDATDSIRKKYGGDSIFPGIVINDQ